MPTGNDLQNKIQGNQGAAPTAERRQEIVLLSSVLEKQTKQLIPYFAGTEEQRMISAQAYMRTVLTVVSNSYKLTKCDPKSILGGLMTSVALRLDLLPQLGQAYLIPYRLKGKNLMAQFQIGYRGLVKLFSQSAHYKQINTGLVREKDVFDITGGSNAIIVHKYDFRVRPEERGDVIGYYAICKFQGGGEQFAFMNQYEMEDFARKYSPALKGKKVGELVFDENNEEVLEDKSPWLDPVKKLDMGLKTVIIKAVKKSPLVTDDRFDKMLVYAVTSDESIREYPTEPEKAPVSVFDLPDSNKERDEPEPEPNPVQEPEGPRPPEVEQPLNKPAPETAPVTVANTPKPPQKPVEQPESKAVENPTKESPDTDQVDVFKEIGLEDDGEVW